MDIDLRFNGANIECDNQITQKKDDPSVKRSYVGQLMADEGTEKTIREKDPEEEAQRQYRQLIAHDSTIEIKTPYIRPQRINGRWLAVKLLESMRGHQLTADNQGKFLGFPFLKISRLVDSCG